MANNGKEFRPILKEEMRQMIFKLGKEVTQLKRNRNKILKNQEHITTEPELLHKAVEASADKNKTVRAKAAAGLEGSLVVQYGMTYTQGVASRILGFSPRTIKRMLVDGRLRAVGSRWKYRQFRNICTEQNRL